MFQLKGVTCEQPESGYQTPSERTPAGRYR
jgi:hypothetical protein